MDTELSYTKTKAAVARVPLTAALTVVSCPGQRAAVLKRYRVSEDGQAIRSLDISAAIPAR